MTEADNPLQNPPASDPQADLEASSGKPEDFVDASECGLPAKQHNEDGTVIE